MTNAEYQRMTDAQKYEHWRRMVPRNADERQLRTRAMRMFKP